MKNYGKLAAMLLFGWFIIVLSASALQLFRNDANRIGISVAFASLTPVVSFTLWFAASKKFREFVLSLNPRVLTAVQSWRIIGFTFVLLEAYGALPAIFAWPAGYGDMAIGVTATFVAWKLADSRHRNFFMFWQVLGIADLVNAVALGTTAGFLNPQGPSISPMTVLPLSLIPTFLVPLFLIFHVICIAQARKWKGDLPYGQQTASPMRHSAG
jgi:hypothetical protein